MFRLQNAFVSAVVAGSASAQTELNLTYNVLGLGHYQIEATLFNPTRTVLATISDLGFTLYAKNITGFTYNPAFDSQFFGDATFNVTSSFIEFRGLNTLPPLNNSGGPDASNPLVIGEFFCERLLHYWEGPDFHLNGQVTGAYRSSPFPEILIYQNADGSPGNVPFSSFFYQFPSPGTFSLPVFAGVYLRRRR